MWNSRGVRGIWARDHEGKRMVKEAAAGRLHAPTPTTVAPVRHPSHSCGLLARFACLLACLPACLSWRLLGAPVFSPAPPSLALLPHLSPMSLCLRPTPSSGSFACFSALPPFVPTLHRLHSPACLLSLFHEPR